MSEPTQSRKPLVVITDDDEAGRYALAHPLRQAGFEVEEAATAAETLKAVSAREVDALVLDINLPDLDGREVCRRIRAGAATSLLPIVQVSATYRSDEDWIHSLETGADVFLAQPVVPGVLVATLRALLRTRAAERRLEETLASITDAYIGYDDEDRIVAVNRQAEEAIFHRPAEEVVGKRLWDLFPEVSRAAWSHYAIAREEGRPVRFEMHSTVVDRWYEVNAYPRPGRLDVYLRDITERQRAEEERAHLLEVERQAREAAEDAGRAKDDFLAILSHELRTPMNAIVGWLAVLRSPAATPQQVQQGLDVIYRNVMAQNQLICDLLDVSRIVSGKLVLDERPVDPGEAVHAALETVGQMAKKKGVGLTSEVERGLVVSGDPDRLQQIVWNLLANAVKFTPKGGLVRVTLRREGGRAGLTVTDTGEGIEPRFLPHVFERFRQGDASHTRRYRGLGLGLAIARHLVERLGGEITADSPGVGQGATFRVALPLVDAKVAALEAATPRSVHGVHVLLVDDEEDSLAVTSVLLERSGARVTTAASAREALEAFRQGGVDVVVSDLEMPGEDGYTLLAALRGVPGGAEVPVIALTAHASEAERHRAMAEGFASHVAKPVLEADLTAAVRRVSRPPGRPAVP